MSSSSSVKLNQNVINYLLASYRQRRKVKTWGHRRISVKGAAPRDVVGAAPRDVKGGGGYGWPGASLPRKDRGLRTPKRALVGSVE